MEATNESTPDSIDVDVSDRRVQNSFRTLDVVAWGAIGVGLVARLIPLTNLGERLLKQFPTEDGYLMLTIARNLAIGKGFSVADGTIATNGTQPLVTLLYSLAFAATGGERAAAVSICLLLQTIFAVLTAWWIYRIGDGLLRNVEGAKSYARLGAALWFVSAVEIGHSMNCLETGAYLSATAAAVYLFLFGTRGDLPWSTMRCVGFGALLGVVFLTRNDAVFLIAAICLVHLLRARLTPAVPVRRRLFEAVLFGAVSVAVASPWLVYNLTSFGSIVPISGTSQSLDTPIGMNLPILASTLVEHLSVVVAIPHVLQQKPTIAIVCGVVVVATVPTAIALFWRRGDSTSRLLIAIGSIVGICLSAYYGLFFGASHFVSRYLSPVSLFGTLAIVVTASFVSRRGARHHQLVSAFAVLALVLSAGLQFRLFRKGTDHMHWQVVTWVENNVPETSWAGAPQTGTLGFFHDRTINLDGKVNPEALEARRNRSIPRYINDRGIDYLVDWEGLHQWQELPEISANFDLVVHDREANLAAFRRKGAETLLP